MHDIDSFRVLKAVKVKIRLKWTQKKFPQKYIHAYCLIHLHISVYSYWIMSGWESNSLRLCLVGVILGRMENKWEKNREKRMFLVESGKDERFWWGPQIFSPPLQNTIFWNWKENKSKKWTKIFRQNCPHFHFTFSSIFGYLNLAVNVAGLPFFFLLGLVGRWIFFFFFYNMMMCELVIHHSTIQGFFWGYFFFLIFLIYFLFFIGHEFSFLINFGWLHFFWSVVCLF